MITLADGRTVALEEYGHPDGVPAVWLHGAFASRLDGAFLDAAARELGVRLVSLDRAGVGGSTPHPGRTLLGYASDVVEVLDALGLAQAVVGGQSAGGSYAMAVAATAPDRVSRVVPYNAATPVGDPAARAALSRTAKLSYAYMARRGDRVAARLHDPKPPGRLARALSPRNPDADLLADPGIAVAKAASEAEVLRQGDNGYLAEEMALVGRPWGFDHRAVRQPVTVVSGEHDAGLGYARVWADELPDGRLVVVPGGHVGYLAPAVARLVVEQLRGPL